MGYREAYLHHLQHWGPTLNAAKGSDEVLRFSCQCLRHPKSNGHPFPEAISCDQGLDSPSDVLGRQLGIGRTAYPVIPLSRVAALDVALKLANECVLGRNDPFDEITNGDNAHQLFPIHDGKVTHVFLGHGLQAFGN